LSELKKFAAPVPALIVQAPVICLLSTLCYYFLTSSLESR